MRKNTFGLYLLILLVVVSLGCSKTPVATHITVIDARIDSASILNYADEQVTIYDQTGGSKNPILGATVTINSIILTDGCGCGLYYHKTIPAPPSRDNYDNKYIFIGR